MLSHYIEIVLSKLQNWQESLFATLPNAVVALLVVITFLGLSRVVGSAVNRAVARAAETSALGKLAASLARYGVFAVGLFIALEVLGLDKAVTSLLAGAGIVGLALGFAFQDLAANFVAGVVMSVRKPFKVGDLVETNGHLGFIRKLNMRNTFVETFSGQMVLIPNRLVFEKALENYSYTGFRRVDFEVPIPFHVDPDEAREVAEGAVRQLPFLAPGRPVEAFALGYGARGFEMQVRYWVVYPSEENYFDAIHRGVSAVRRALAERGIRIGYAVQTLDLSMAEEQAVSVKVAS